MASNAEGRDLFRTLADGTPPSPVLILYGEESFLIDEAVRAIVTSLFPTGPDDFSHQVFTGGEASGDTIRQALETLSLFGGRRLIHLRNLTQVAAADLEALESYLDRPAPDTFLLMTGRAVDLRKRFFKAAKKAKSARLVSFKPLYDNELAGWVQRRARGKKLVGIDRSLAQMIADWTGPRLSDMDSALDKLSLFTAEKGGKVGEEELRHVLDDTRSRSVFEFTDRLGKRELEACIDTIERMLQAGDSAVGMVSMVARHFRIVWKVKEGASRGLRGRDLAMSAGCPPPFLGTYQGDARRFSDARLKNCFNAIHEAERSLKSVPVPDGLVLANMVMAICLDDTSKSESVDTARR